MDRGGIPGRIRSALVALVTGGLMALAPAATASQVPSDATWEETYMTSSDGDRLHVDIFRPKGLAPDAKTPVILITGPYFSFDPSDPPGRPRIMPEDRDVFDRAFQSGYSIVQVAIGGHGESTGCADFGPDENADAVSAVRWAAKQPWSTGKVGTYGGSAAGTTQVAALAGRVEGHAAAVIGAPVSDLYRGLYMNGIGYLLYRELFAPYQNWANAVGLAPAPLSSPPERQVDSAAGKPERVRCTSEAQAQALNPHRETAFWRERNLISAASGSRVPTLWVGGAWDYDVKPDQIHEIYGSQTGPKRLWFGQTGHVPPSAWQEVAGRGSQLIDETMRWFDRYVKGVPASKAPVKNDPPAVIQEGYEGRWRSETSWPPADGSSHEFLIRPGSYRDAPGNKAEPGGHPGWSPERVGRCFVERDPQCMPVPHGVGTWTFTKPFPYPAHVSGIGRVSVEVEQAAPSVNVIALLYVVDEQNRAVLITRGAWLSRRSGTVSFDLMPQDWELRAGHRLGLLLTGADDFLLEPGVSGTEVRVRGGRLSLPFLSTSRTTFLDGGPSRRIQERETFEVDPSGSEVDAPFPPAMKSAKRGLMPRARHKGDGKQRGRWRRVSHSGARRLGISASGS